MYSGIFRISVRGQRLIEAPRGKCGTGSSPTTGGGVCRAVSQKIF